MIDIFNFKQNNELINIIQLLNHFCPIKIILKTYFFTYNKRFETCKAKGIIFNFATPCYRKKLKKR